MRKYIYILPIAILPLLNACTGTLDNSPSLNKRAFEISLSEMRELAGKESASSDSALVQANMSQEELLASLDTETQTLWQNHKKADTQFDVRANIVQQTVNKARGSAFGSERWSVAQVSLSRLDRLRAASVSSLNEIDAMIFATLDNRSDLAASNQAAGDNRLSALLQVQKMIETDVSVQSRYIERLNNILAQ